MTPLAQANIEVLEQLKTLIGLCTEHYKSKGNRQGIGQHVRHVLDHYRAFEQGLHTNSVDYNLRTRNSADENDFEHALSNIELIISLLETVNNDSESTNVISEISVHECQTETMPSTLKRELLYLLNHSIHHMAYATQMVKAYGVEVPSNVGLAPSTVHQKTNRNLIPKGAPQHALA